MHSLQRVWYGLLAGCGAAAIDGLLIVTTDPSASGWLLTQAMLFWVTAGLLVVTSRFGLGDLADGIVATVVLGIPWYVNLSLAPGRPDMLAPLVAMSVIVGFGFGLTRRWISRRWEPGPSIPHILPNADVARADR